MNALSNINLRGISNSVLSLVPQKCLNKRVALLFATLVAVGGGVGFWRWSAAKNQQTVSKEYANKKDYMGENLDFYMNEFKSILNSMSIEYQPDYLLYVGTSLAFPKKIESKDFRIISERKEECGCTIFFSLFANRVGIIRFFLPNKEEIIIKTQPGWFGYKLNQWNKDGTFNSITKDQFIGYYNQIAKGSNKIS